MAQLLLPDFSSDVVQEYGIKKLYEYNPGWFRDRPAEEKPIIAYADQPLDISGNRYDIWTNPNEIPGNNFDDDGNGFADDIHGWNFVDNSPEYSPGGSHGKTGVNALVAPAPEALQIMPLQVAEDEGAFERLLLNAVRHAGGENVLAVNTSFGKSTEAFVTYIVSGLAENEVFWTCPAGYWPAKMIDYPEKCDTRWIISTGAIGLDGIPKSAGGSHCLFYAYAGAVSFASPQPGSVLALLKTIDPSLNQLDLRSLLIAGAQMTPEIEGKCQHGIINHLGSVEALLGHSIDSTSVPAPDPVEEKPEEETPEIEPKQVPKQVQCRTVNVRHSANGRRFLGRS